MNRKRTIQRRTRALASPLALSTLLVAFPSPAEPADPAARSFAPVVAAPASAAFPLETPPAEQPPPAPPPTNATLVHAPAEPEDTRAPAADHVPDRDAGQSALDDDDDARERWMLSVEGVTRAPVDAGLQAVLETPIGVRVGGGYGWMPAAYLNLTSNVLQLAATDQTTPRFESGRVLRAQIGLRPFRYFGAYIDAGYARANLEGRLADDGGANGKLASTMELDLWFAELGYQSLIADRIVLAIGIGVTGVLDARTSVDTSGTDAELAANLTQSSDALIEDYGYVPTLTLRLGFDMI